MGMRDAFDDYGLVLDDEDMLYFAEKLRQERNDVDTDPFTEEDGADTLQEYLNEYVVYIYALEGEPFRVDENGMDYRDYGDNCFDFSEDTIYYIPPQKYPNYFKQAYNSLDEIINEFKSLYSKYLPEEFPYQDRFYHIIGTYF